MDQEKIINFYKGNTEFNREPSITLSNGEEVISEVVDDDNKLHYVVSKGNDISIVPAENQSIGNITLRSDIVSITVENTSKKE